MQVQRASEPPRACRAFIAERTLKVLWVNRRSNRQAQISTRLRGGSLAAGQVAQHRRTGEGGASSNRPPREPGFHWLGDGGVSCTAQRLLLCLIIRAAHHLHASCLYCRPAAIAAPSHLSPPSRACRAALCRPTTFVQACQHDTMRPDSEPFGGPRCPCGASSILWLMSSVAHYRQLAAVAKHQPRPTNTASPLKNACHGH